MVDIGVQNRQHFSVALSSCLFLHYFLIFPDSSCPTSFLTLTCLFFFPSGAPCTSTPNCRTKVKRVISKGRVFSKGVHYLPCLFFFFVLSDSQFLWLLSLLLYYSSVLRPCPESLFPFLLLHLISYPRLIFFLPKVRHTKKGGGRNRKIY